MTENIYHCAFFDRFYSFSAPAVNLFHFYLVGKRSSCRPCKLVRRISLQALAWALLSLLSVDHLCSIWSLANKISAYYFLRWRIHLSTKKARHRLGQVAHQTSIFVINDTQLPIHRIASYPTPYAAVLTSNPHPKIVHWTQQHNWRPILYFSLSSPSIRSKGLTIRCFARSRIWV